MPSKKDKILSAAIELLHSQPWEVNQITTQDWIEILRTKGVNTTPNTFIKHFQKFLNEEYDKNNMGYHVPEQGYYVWGNMGHEVCGNKMTTAPIKYCWFFT